MKNLFKKTERKKLIWTIISIAIVIFIFSNSLKPDDLSSADSGRVYELIRCILGVPSWLTEGLIRKTAHFTEYFIAAILHTICMRQYNASRSTMVLAGIPIALADETIQLFVPGRNGSVVDVWIDSAGYAAGVIVTTVVLNAVSARKKNGVA